MNIFTYGSLMFDEVWNRVVSEKYESQSVIVHGYERFSLTNEEYPAVIPASSECFVSGSVYFDISSSDLQRLDIFEGEYYKRESVSFLW